MDWETEKKIRTKRFWLGAFTGFAAAVFLWVIADKFKLKECWQEEIMPPAVLRKQM